MFLNKNNGVGDVFVEARGSKEDRKMREAYKNVYESGTNFISSSEIRKRVRSSQVKFCSKETPRFWIGVL